MRSLPSPEGYCRRYWGTLCFVLTPVPMRAAPSKLLIPTVAFASALALGAWLFVEAGRTFEEQKRHCLLQQQDREDFRAKELQEIQKAFATNEKLRNRWLPSLESSGMRLPGCVKCGFFWNPSFRTPQSRRWRRRIRRFFLRV
jgi:hypothetical protein